MYILLPSSIKGRRSYFSRIRVKRFIYNLNEAIKKLTYVMQNKYHEINYEIYFFFVNLVGDINLIKAKLI